MPKAAPTTTTTTAAPDKAPPAVAALKATALRQRYTLPEPATGDALLQALAAEYRQADRFGVAFEEAATAATGTMKTYMMGPCEGHYSRRDIIGEAILAVQATDLAGAMIQIEALALLPISPSSAYRSHIENLRDLGCQSIFRALANLTARTTEDGLGVLVPARDQLACDVEAHQAACLAFFAENNMTPAPAATATGGTAGAAEGASA